MVEWVFPVDDSDDPELGYAMAHRTRDFRQRHAEVPRGPMRFVVGDGTLIFMEAHLPVLRAFLKAYDAAPTGTEFVTCARCGCRTLWVGAELRGADNTGPVCDEHDCTHGAWNTRRDAVCRFCGDEIWSEAEAGVTWWLSSYTDAVECTLSSGTPSVHKPVS
jgi:hypothetical protein